MSTRFEKKKIEIIKAAEKRFIKHGLYKTTVDEIARDVRIGKSTIYHYFASKEELFYVTVEQEREQYLEQVKEIFSDPSASSEDKFSRYLTVKMGMPDNYRLLYKLMLECLNGGSNALEDDIFLKYFGEEMKVLSALLPARTDNSPEAPRLSPECIMLSTFTFPLLRGLHQMINEKTVSFLHDVNCSDELTKQFGWFLAMNGAER
jgi:AcrR family transcriptional regulator